MNGLMKLLGCGLLLVAGQALGQTVEYIHTDALGSPVAITDALGNVVERQVYEPYGVSMTREATDGPGFTGHVGDSTTALTYMQQRYYDPQIGRFLSVDPVAAMFSPGSLFGRYRYAANNPYRFLDPDGRIERTTGSNIAGSGGFSGSRLLGGVGPPSLRSSDDLDEGSGAAASAQPSDSSRSTKLNSASAWDHYRGGSGKALRISFDDVDTSSVQAIDFPQVHGLIGGDKNGVFPVDDRNSFSTSGDEAGYLGNITLRLQGNLSLSEGKYSFGGTLKSFDDRYDFNWSTHRSFLGEALTRFGATQKGVPYDIEIRGEKPLNESGAR